MSGHRYGRAEPARRTHARLDRAPSNSAGFRCGGIDDERSPTRPDAEWVRAPVGSLVQRNFVGLKALDVRGFRVKSCFLAAPALRRCACKPENSALYRVLKR